MTQPGAPPARAEERAKVRRKGFFRRNLRRLLLAVAILVAAAFFLAGKLKPLPVVATPVVRGEAIDAVYATGTVEAEERVQIKAKTSGSVAVILVKEGDRV